MLLHIAQTVQWDCNYEFDFKICDDIKVYLLVGEIILFIKQVFAEWEGNKDKHNNEKNATSDDSSGFRSKKM